MVTSRGWIGVALSGLVGLWTPWGVGAQPTTTNEGEFTTHSSNAPRFGTPIATGADGAIYVCYIDPNLDTVLVRKDPGTGAWSSPTVLEANTRNDAFHTQCSIGVDTDGFIHAVYNMHNTPWQYRRSASANDISTMTFHGQDAGTTPGGGDPAAAGCTGQCETDWYGDGIAAIPGNQISYPHFGQTADGTLYLAYRECFDCDASFFARQWSAGLSLYNTATQTWSRVGGVRPWATDASRLPVGVNLWGSRTGRLHVSWLWCLHYNNVTHPSDPSEACFNQPNHPTYAYSDDGGTTWHRANGAALTLPISFAASEQIVSPTWFDTAGAAGYWAGNTHIGAGPTNQPVVMTFPEVTNTTLGIRRGYVTYVAGAWTPATPLALNFSPGIVYPDAQPAGVWTAVSGGLRLHRSLDGGQTWTETTLDTARGSFSVAYDKDYLHHTGHLRLYANNATTGLLVIWTVQFPETNQTFYVSTSGNDSNSCLAPWSACATIASAVTKASCGDTVQIQPGTYYQRTTITKSCTAGAPLTIQGVRGVAGAWATVVEGTDATSGWTSASGQCAGCFRIANPGYVPFALIALPQRLTVWRIHDDQMGGETCPSGCDSNGFTWLGRGATSTISRTVGTVTAWDGVEALWGEEGGFTYLRFRNGEDPDDMQVRVAPGATANRATFLFDGADHIIVQDLEIIGGRHVTAMENSPTFITLQRNDMHGGHHAVEAFNGSNITIAENMLDPRFIGSTAGYAATPYTPGDWNNSTYERRVKNNIYVVNKFMVGDTTEHYNAPLALNQTVSNVTIRDNTLRNVNAGIWLEDSFNTHIAGNLFENASAELIWSQAQPDNTYAAYIYNNTFIDAEHHVRIQQLELPRTLYFYGNKFYQPSVAGKHIHFSFAQHENTVSPAKIWVYHNTFTGGGWTLDMGGDACCTYVIPCLHALNNVISVSGADGTKGISSSVGGYHAKAGIFAYNSVQAVTGLHSAGVNGNGCTAFVGNNTVTNTAIWTTPPIPDFILPDGQAALDSGIRLDQNFTINGIVYPALPGMTAAYYGDGLPDRGALQGSETVPPPPPEPVLTQTAGACYQVDLPEGSAEGLRPIPCAVKPGGRIRLVLPVGVTGADVTTAFGVYASDSGGTAYKLASTLGANRLAVGSDTQIGTPTVTQRLPLGGQQYDACCRWRQGTDGAQSCVLSATGAGERTECGVTLQVAVGATPGQTSTLWLRHDDGTPLDTETPVTVTIIQPSGEGM